VPDATSGSVAAIQPFHEIGDVDGLIDVEVTYQIIGLFSEGLYSTPYKALEELVSNSFDADATHVHVVIPADLGDDDATIVVLDDGVGMDDSGLRTHWIVGDSIKRLHRATRGGRKTIGKFGIGKLAAYVLGDRLTHITRVGDAYYSTTMDFSTIPKTVEVDAREGGRTSAKPVQLPLRHLTEEQARDALHGWLDQEGKRQDLALFGDGGPDTWTVAVISDLKPMALEITIGKLNWLLGTAMPLRDDFKLYLNNKPVASSKVKGKKVGSWTLGKDLITLPKPAPPELEPGEKESIAAPAFAHWHVTDSILGPVSGYLEVFVDPIDSGNSLKLGRSNGFFVYVNGRLINPDDAGFGIDRNQLRHGTFSRFRFVVNVDRLDEELRSSRESLRDGPQVTRAKELLQGVFNFARTKLDTYVADTSTGRHAAQRLADSPASLSERPILQLVLAAFEDGGASSRHVSLGNVSQFKTAAELRTYIEKRIVDDGALVTDVITADLGVHQPIAVLEGVSGLLQINLEHPFVAHFADEFGNQKRNLPLQLFAMSEVLLEAHLRASGIDREQILTVLDERDELLRHLARSRGRENSLTVAQDLLASVGSAKELELSVVAAFSQLGFEAVPRGGKDVSDGIAEAPLAASGGESRHYRVSLEAKSKEKHGAKVSKDGVGVSTIARHRDESHCSYAIVVGPAFQTGPKELGAVMREIASDQEQTGKTITLMEAQDLARLVRMAPVKRLNLAQMRTLFEECRSPADCKKWLEDREAEEPAPARYKDILEVVWQEQQDDIESPVEYGALRAALRHSREIKFTTEELKNECQALARMAPNQFFARDDVVELNIRPDRLLDLVHDYLDREKQETS
jgi:hypothetical protein